MKDLLRRLERLESADNDIIAFDAERPMPDGSLELHSKHRELWGLPSLVATVPASEVAEFRRRMIRIRPARQH